MTAFKVFKREDVVRGGTVSDMDFGDWLMVEGKIDKELFRLFLLDVKLTMHSIARRM